MRGRRLLPGAGNRIRRHLLPEFLRQSGQRAGRRRGFCRRLPRDRADRFRRRPAGIRRVRAHLDGRRERLRPAGVARLSGAAADALREMGVAAPLLVGNSNGGLSTASVACRSRSSSSRPGAPRGDRRGPARRALSARKNLIVFDMGGTTASAALMHDGVLSRANEYEFRAGMSVPSRFIKAGGYMMRVPTIDVAEVGSGAGSIAAVDDGGLLCVGPLSAGAVPGPGLLRDGRRAADSDRCQRRARLPAAGRSPAARWRSMSARRGARSSAISPSRSAFPSRMRPPACARSPTPTWRARSAP